MSTASSTTGKHVLKKDSSEAFRRILRSESTRSPTLCVVSQAPADVNKKGLRGCATW
ncbi:unnamed protein product, partial [Ceratitis capitata]